MPDRTRDGLEVEGRPLLAVPAVCAVVATGILVYDHFVRVNLLAIALATATLALVVVRLAATFRENSRLFELTRAEATTDALTGLGNRRQLLDDLARRLAARPSQPTLLMLFDLDGFKGYNDTFGHPAGDALLHAARREARGRSGIERRRLPARRRRVLPPGVGRRRRGRAAHRPRLRGAHRAR